MSFFPPVPASIEELADTLVEIQNGSIEDALALLDPHMQPDMQVREELLRRQAMDGMLEEEDDLALDIRLHGEENDR